ncbi:hypothetical protein [Desulfovibrio sp. JC010]|uniref:hypothetical protein n=1 Tax=Desulfovibrio sp. JC010 TaxID=2593641 RepID=UPI0013D51212|nr:hypothetical protein [Desulfovibrio sp. JC010]NDV28040.1 hypothetical protein [Desulfovibrio sp. JC010]
MFKSKLIIFIFGLLLLSTSAFAAERELFPASEFKLGYEGMYMYYDEPNVMHEKGILNGGFAAWTGYFSQYNIMLSAELEGLAGSLRYHGKYSDGTPLECNTNDYFVSGRATMGMGFEYDRIGVTPYLGIAARYWNDDIKATGGYERQIKQLYLPIGINLVARLDDGWSIGGTLEGDLLLGGKVKSKLSDAGPNYEDVNNKQEFGSGGGGRISAFLEYDFDDYALGMEPYFRYWQFDDSEKDTVSTGTYIEPKNKFYMSGLRLYVKF